MISRERIKARLFKKTNHFVIQDNVYDKITDATTDIWIPIHMNHMVVNEAYRVWHGEPFKEGYKQAPPNTDHFDLHSQGPNMNTKFESLERINNSHLDNTTNVKVL